MNPNDPKPGDRFRHKHFLDVTWKPGPGQRYADAPKAIMRVTRVTRNAIYYRCATGGTPWVIGRDKFPSIVSEIVTESN